MVRPLDGIRVIDTSTGPVGGLATMVLADFGADVIKIEPPDGDRFRVLANSPLWLRGKRSVVLDLRVNAAREHLHELVARADVVVTSGPPDRASRWGIDATQSAALRADIVHCSVTGWGEHGPLASLPGYATAVAARAGRMQSFAGQIVRPGPVYAAIPVAAHAAAFGAVQGIVSALISRARHGGAQRVATSLLQGLLPYDLVELLIVQRVARGDIPAPPSTAGDMPTLNYHPILASDGTWIQCGNLLEHLLLSFLDAIDLYGELLTDERFLESPALWSPEAIEEARDRILLRVREKTADEWMKIFAANGNVAAEPYRDCASALTHPDLIANGSIVQFNDPVVGPVTTIGACATLSKTPAIVQAPAPRIGEHTDAILQELQQPIQTLARPTVASATLQTTTRRAATSPNSSPSPLDGITIVEFASVIAAPLGVSMLADLGARVIRIEPIEGDSFRQLLAEGIMAVKTTASKESICVDLKHPEGRAIAQSFIERADALVHNYRPGVAERLGIGYDLAARYPQLVWVAVNGYGPNGPSARRPATHPVAGASMGGPGYQAGRAVARTCSSLADIRENSRQLMRANEPSPDPNTSVIVASAIALGLLARERHGVGQQIHVDMLTANAYANADAFIHYDGVTSRPPIDDDHFGTGPCNRLYKAADGWLFVTITTNEEWERFCNAFDPALAEDAAFANVASRERNASQLTKTLEELLSTRTVREVQALAAASKVSVVQADAASPGVFYATNDHMHANNFAPMATHARFGEIRRWGPLVTVNGSRSSYATGVLAGEHTDALLRELGFTADRITRLRADGVVASE